MRSVNRTMPHSAACLMPSMNTPSTPMPATARNAARPWPALTASISRPASTGVSTSASVASVMPTPTSAAMGGCRRQWATRNPKTPCMAPPYHGAAASLSAAGAHLALAGQPNRP